MLLLLPRSAPAVTTRNQQSVLSSPVGSHLFSQGPSRQLLQNTLGRQTMCDYEEFLFACGCSTIRLKSYCHFARNDPNHQCFGVKKLRNSWEQVKDCEACSQQKTRGQWGTVQGFGVEAANGSITSSSHNQSRRKR
ncbi:hypothetical protein QBC33DRAFT_236543 [Phialemonium atrogriseum]|uniref:Uncharacterized protein n=1 Tax=Phialemonium atrogriseum TaxID=1093897 RepID=A0AAJ0C754_9PEZI|nr:uncharacterized protein QBC33DRAFT_236543 [Phialemonium atrogriseum]KAK1771205.1 hypothetical protein QBC33DRAFT_236543 [Phialemonium atrogriseum]